ncbi:MAG: primosomal protein N' [Chitinophagaceae bacterium]|nr:primosomal protein N' [Chitinophagaceae bacterium]MCW5914431.1 primosomal protein N' [Chitinophagaceae bacterium]MCZ2397172.1 primosomal protein N' [Chitinophagales bacterium]
MESNLTAQDHQSSEWIEVILPLAVPYNFTYSVPADLRKEVKPGCRVEVVFGKNKKYSGIVKAFVGKPAFETKEILNLIDKEPVIYPQQLQLWQWISRYYMCSEGEVLSAALPAHLKLSSESVIIFNENFGDDFSSLTDDEYILAEALLIKKELRLSEVKKVTSLANVYPLLRRMVEKEVCYIFESLEETYKPRKENYVTLSPEYDSDDQLNKLMDKLGRAPKQLELLLAYLHFSRAEGEVKQQDLLKKADASPSHLKGLTDKGILLIENRIVDRMPALPKMNQLDFELDHRQATALKEIKESFRTKKICLLHGVTGSGKTLIYMNLIRDMISKGKQVLYLLPEITLTTQIIRRLQKCFGGNVAIYHSKFSSKERMEIWNKVKKGEVRVVVGARSALFLPFENLELIIIDEEQDSSFKQYDPAPRYNARDAAIYYALLFNAKVLMGSATPSLDSFYNAQRGKYGLVNLKERFGAARLPEIRIIDMKSVGAPAGQPKLLSPQLKETIEITLKHHRQIILFQNRRGYSPFLICGTCGYIPKCVNCDVSLTLHKSSNKLHCHYCGNVYSRLIQCPGCGSTNWLERNFGTEKIEEVLANEFPSARIARMDYDSVKGKYAHDELIKRFEQHHIDILVGTQMVVKGLDFANVLLIGVLDADSLLSFSDFRVNERAFQMLEQVSGRAGRKDGDGTVLIQATKTDHPILTLVKAHDYDTMYQTEIVKRDEFYYPPYSRLLKLTFKHKQPDIVKNAAHAFSTLLSKNFKNFLGPAEPVIPRIKNQYLQEIMLKLPPDIKKLEIQKEIILNNIHLLKAEKRYRSVVIVADVDPA